MDRCWAKDDGYLPSAWTAAGVKGLTVVQAAEAGKRTDSVVKLSLVSTLLCFHRIPKRNPHIVFSYNDAKTTAACIHSASTTSAEALLVMAVLLVSRSD